MDFLGMGLGEIILILVVALLIFGPQRLPELAATVGKWYREFQRTSQMVTQEFTRQLAEEAEMLKQEQEQLNEIKQELQEVRNGVSSLNVPFVPAPAHPPEPAPVGQDGPVAETTVDATSPVEPPVEMGSNGIAASATPIVPEPRVTSEPGPSSLAEPSAPLVPKPPASPTPGPARATPSWYDEYDGAADLDLAPPRNGGGET